MVLTHQRVFRFRQYQRLFEFENVRLRFADDAIETVAELALQRKVGARGLRMILEDLMLELMYHLPAQRKLREFVVTAEMVRSREINWTLLVERESFAAVVVSIFLFCFALAARFYLAWYCRKKLGVVRERLRDQILRAGQAMAGNSQ